jgi:uncharacterized protein (DUF2336 family)
VKIRAYLTWSQTATASDRAEAVGILARICLSPELPPHERREGVAALTLALDDPSPLVRLAMAQALAASEFAPRHLIAALVDGGAEAAAIVISHSPALTDAELVDTLAVGDEGIQTAVAGRPFLASGVAAAIAEVGCAAANIALLGNPGAEIPEFSLHRMIERHADDGALREALLQRGDLPIEIRLKLALTASARLSDFARDAGWLSDQRAERLSRDCRDDAAVVVAANASAAEVSAVVSCLAEARSLTPQLLLRALMCGETTVFAAALASLADVPLAKASALAELRNRFGFAALYKKAGLPAALEPVFAAALAAVARERGDPNSGLSTGRLSRRVIERTMVFLSEEDSEARAAATPVLARLQAEAARAEARELVAGILAMPEEPPTIPEFAARDPLHPELESRLEEALALEFREAA